MKPIDAAYWDNRYQTSQTGWDIGGVSTPLKAYFDQLTDRNLRILIPGAGNAYEAEYLLRQGFGQVTVLDISPEIIRRLETRLQPWLGRELELVCADYFDHRGQYDRIIEQTFFCALEPSLRAAYGQKTVELLKPGGKLAGVLFDRNFDGEGPPFGGSKEEYETLFPPYFRQISIEDCYNSIVPRMGTEVFIRVVR